MQQVCIKHLLCVRHSRSLSSWGLLVGKRETKQAVPTISIIILEDAKHYGEGGGGRNEQGKAYCERPWQKKQASFKRVDKVVLTKMVTFQQ